MRPRSLFLLVPLLVACVGSPPLPGRGILHASDWIPGRSRTVYTSDAGPLEMHNTGETPLHVEHAEGVLVLAPGEKHLAPAGELCIVNPGDDRARLHLVHVAETRGTPAPLPVTATSAGQVRTIQVHHRDRAALPVAPR